MPFHPLVEITKTDTLVKSQVKFNQQVPALGIAAASFLRVLENDLD